MNYHQEGKTMCGRYTITLDPEAVRQGLELKEMPADWVQRYNVAPSQPVAVVTNPEERSVHWMKWGLIPFWAKDPAIGNKMINARSETILEKPAFKAAFARRRCLVIADGFYEWQKGAGPKGRAQPYLFKRNGGEPFAFAGLWEQWKSPAGEEVQTCTIITCAANALVAPVHERMPVMLSDDNLWDWLSEGQPNQLTSLLRPYPADGMARFPVSTQVNRPEIDSPELVQPIVL
jgi:putative SOS response-associated peptidase YedK